MAHTIDTTAPVVKRRPRRRAAGRRKSSYPYWFLIPARLIFVVFFLVPSLIAFYFSLTRWTLFDQEFIGLDNFRQFFAEPALVSGLTHTLIYAVVTCGLKVVLGMALAVLLTGPIIGRGFLRSVAFFPVLVSTIGVGITFQVLMHPTQGAINQALGLVGISGPGLAGRPASGRCSRSRSSTSGRASGWPPSSTWPASCPSRGSTSRPPRSTARRRGRPSGTSPCRWPSPPPSRSIILSLIGGLRSFDLIWAMTKGGPGFTSDVMASVIYKQYQAGFYGLSTAGNVMLFLLVTVIVVPLFWFLNRKEVDA